MDIVCIGAFGEGSDVGDICRFGKETDVGDNFICAFGEGSDVGDKCADGKGWMMAMLVCKDDHI